MLDRQAFNLPYKVLTILGFWGPHVKNNFIKSWYWVYQSLAYSYLYAFTACGIVDLYIFRKDVRKVSTNLTATVTTCMLLYKNSIALGKFSQIESHKKRMSKGLYSFIHPKDEWIVNHAIKEVKQSCYMVLGLTASAISCWVMLPFIFGRDEGDRVLPIPVWIPWNFDESPYFELALMFQAGGAYLVAIDALAFNLTIFGSIIQICAEFDILSANFLKINEWCANRSEESPKMLTEVENSIVKRMIVENVKHHQRILRCVDDIENFYVHIMGVQLTGSTGLCIVVGLDLIMALKLGDSRAITLIFMFTLVSVDMALFCYFGSRLKHKGGDFLNQFISIPWEIMNSKNRKAVLIILAKSQRFPKMTIEKFAVIDLVTLVTLSKIIYNVIYLILYITETK